ncbi:MAG: hypothetical protein ACI8WT_004198 [Clostridium sp.]|jgi:hypothetical protein
MINLRVSEINSENIEKNANISCIYQYCFVQYRCKILEKNE